MTLTLKRIQSKKDLIGAIQSFDDKKKIKILEKAEQFERQKLEKKRESEPPVSIPRDNIVMSIVPTDDLGKKLSELEKKIKRLENVDLERFTEDITKMIESNKNNAIASGVNVRETIKQLLKTTIETKAVNMIRGLSLDIKRAQGFTVYNRERDERKEKIVDRNQLREKLKNLQSAASDKDFDTGIETVNRYIRMHIDRLFKECNE